MSVEIDPVELGFHRPFTAEVSQILKIRNPNHTPVAFKVKTTAPKQYCVRPNSGRIEPGKEVEVSVLLQAMKQEPPLDAKCRDKFLVQSVAVTADKEFTNIASIWQHVDDADKSSVQEKKIRVVFLSAEGSAAALTPLRNGVNGISSGGNHESTPDQAPPAYSNRSPSPEDTFTPNQRSNVAGVGSFSKHEEKQLNHQNLGDAKPSFSSSPAISSVRESVTPASAHAPRSSDSAPLSYDDLKAKYAEAQAVIASYAKEGGLKLRKAAAGESSSAIVNEVATKFQGTEGVPIQVVAALCFLSFLLAYLFF